MAQRESAKIDGKTYIEAERFFDGDVRWVRAIPEKEAHYDRNGLYVASKYLSMREWKALVA